VLNSSVFGLPALSIIKAAVQEAGVGTPSFAMPCTAGRMISRITREWTFGVTTGAGEYAPMPPVLGPASPSRRRLCPGW